MSLATWIEQGILSCPLSVVPASVPVPVLFPFSLSLSLSVVRCSCPCPCPLPLFPVRCPLSLSVVPVPVLCWRLTLLEETSFTSPKIKTSTYGHRPSTTIPSLIYHLNLSSKSFLMSQPQRSLISTPQTLFSVSTSTFTKINFSKFVWRGIQNNFSKHTILFIQVTFQQQIPFLPQQILIRPRQIPFLPRSMIYLPVPPFHP